MAKKAVKKQTKKSPVKAIDVNGMDFSQVQTLFTTIIKSQSGVLFIKGRPGIGKSALLRFIAETQGWNFIDLRLAQMDETDFRIPYVKDIDGVRVSGYAHPEWILRANKTPTLICFDEINRASLAVRNAALQLFLEREIGEIKINNNVFMVALGNLGEEDGTEVEEFDNALNNRLIHYKYDMSFPEWRTGYADEKVNPWIISFIENNLDFYYRAPAEGDDTGAYPTPRSWTFLSDLITSVYGEKCHPSTFLNLVKSCGHSYIGTGVTKFLRYCEDTLAISIDDIIERYSQIESDVKKLNRDRKSELLNALKSVDLVKLTKTQAGEKKLVNIAKFVNLIDPDERVAFLNDVLDGVKVNVKIIKANPKFKIFLKQFSDVFDRIKMFV